MRIPPYVLIFLFIHLNGNSLHRVDSYLINCIHLKKKGLHKGLDMDLIKYRKIESRFVFSKGWYEYFILAGKLLTH